MCGLHHGGGPTPPGGPGGNQGPQVHTTVISNSGNREDQYNTEGMVYQQVDASQDNDVVGVPTQGNIPMATPSRGPLEPLEVSPESPSRSQSLPTRMFVTNPSENGHDGSPATIRPHTSQ